MPYTSLATNITQKKIDTIRLKDEIKFLYKEKEKLNNDFCTTNTWKPHTNWAIHGTSFLIPFTYR